MSFEDFMTVYIDWPYFLGIMGSLIVIAWYSSSRFTALETSMERVKKMLIDLNVNTSNAVAPEQAFGAGWPIELKPAGVQWLAESGLKEFIDSHRDELFGNCDDKKQANPYEVQKHVFDMFDTYRFPSKIDDKVKQYAFSKGTTMSVMRRIGAIYFRDICLSQFGMKKEDIDVHAAKAQPNGA